MIRQRSIEWDEWHWAAVIWDLIVFDKVVWFSNVLFSSFNLKVLFPLLIMLLLYTFLLYLPCHRRQTCGSFRKQDWHLVLAQRTKIFVAVRRWKTLWKSRDFLRVRYQLCYCAMRPLRIAVLCPALRLGFLFTKKANNMAHPLLVHHYS